MKLMANMILVSILMPSLIGNSTMSAYHLNPPINRSILDKNQARENQNSQQLENFVYNDSYLSMQWGINQVNANLAWELISNDNSVMVAVVDTGVDYTHEDLSNRVRVDLGYDFVNNDYDPMDDNGHGTHVSGIIAAEANNGVGIAGIVGDLDVSIVPIKVLNANGEGETQNIANGILYAVNRGVDIINLSLGGDVITPEVRVAIETALANDIFVVVASGNDGTLCAPLSLANLDGVFTVAASTSNDMVANFSNFGTCVDSYAPGVNILSTYLDNEYAYQDGTSMAAPFVSGAAAILLAQNPNLTVSELTTLLCSSSTSSTTNTQVTSNQQMQPMNQPMNQQLNQQMNPAIGQTQTSSSILNIYQALLKIS